MKNRNELFVVVATAAVFAVLLISTLGTGTGCVNRDRAKRAYCCNNLKQIGLATWQYAMSYDDWYPTSVSTTKPNWLRANSGDSLDLLRRQDLLTDPKDYLCPSKKGVTAAQPNQTVKGHVSYNWCDGLMAGAFTMSPIACDGTDNHRYDGRFLRCDGSVGTASGSRSTSWTQNREFRDSCYDKTYTDFSF